MLKHLDIENFTVFANATFALGDHINVIHGTNGTGKSHALKLAYAVQHALATRPATAGLDGAPSKSVLEQALAEELVGVFRPDGLGRLVTRTVGRSKSKIAAKFHRKAHNVDFTFSTVSSTSVRLETTPQAWVDQPPIFLPTREALTIYPGFGALYRTHHLEMDRTWLDLADLLGVPVARGVKAAKIKELLGPIEDVMGGKIVLDRAGRFYLVDERGSIEMHLVAEGVRKLAMVARLVANGSLTDKACLLWDEPEANLNPKVIVKVAEMLFALGNQGVQIILATHSLFLMREIEILSVKDQRKAKLRFFGLHASPDGTVEVTSGDTIDESGDIAALDESLAQSRRYIEVEA